jgi:RNA polymerase sigma factor (sigma-70 family)
MTTTDDVRPDPPTHHDPAGTPVPVAVLVAAAAAGDQPSWHALVERYAGLVHGTCRKHRMSYHEAADVSQQVWLRLIEGLGTLREPAALPGWLLTTTRRECLRVHRVRQRELPADLPGDLDPVGDPEQSAPERALLLSEREDAVRKAVATQSTRDRALLALLFADPPLSYSQISCRLEMAVGSVGPARARCLNKLRQHPAVLALEDTDAAPLVTSVAA